MISNLIARLNNKETNLEIIIVNKIIILILDTLELKGFINYSYNPYTNKAFIYNNKIKHIVIKSKPGRKIYIDKEPYKLGLGEFIINNKELLLYVE